MKKVHFYLLIAAVATALMIYNILFTDFSTLSADNFYRGDFGIILSNFFIVVSMSTMAWCCREESTKTASN